MKQTNTKKTINQLVQFIQSTFQSAGFSKAVIAVSGGVDSATSLFLTTKALGKENIFPLFLPYGALNDQGVIDAKLATTALGIPEENIQTINIQPMVDAIVSYDISLCHPPVYTGGSLRNSEIAVRRGNVMARVRMIVVFDQAKKQKALVVGTENKTEHYLGYYTRFGDEASDVEPLRNLYKTEVYELAKAIGVPQAILTKAPTAGLWEGQTDEGEFGFTYKEADEILFRIYDEKQTKSEVVQLGYRKDCVEKVLSLVKKNDFKHHLPYNKNL